MNESQVPQNRFSPKTLFLAFFYFYFYLLCFSILLYLEKKSLSSIGILPMKPCADQDDRYNHVYDWKICFYMYIHMRELLLWMRWYKVLLNKGVFLQLNDFLEPYFNILVMPLVHLHIWISFCVFFYHDIKIFLFFVDCFLEHMDYIMVNMREIYQYMIIVYVVHQVQPMILWYSYLNLLFLTVFLQ